MKNHKYGHALVMMALLFTQTASAAEKNIACLTLGRLNNGKTTGVRLTESEDGGIKAYVSSISMFHYIVVSVDNTGPAIPVEATLTHLGNYYNTDDRSFSLLLYFGQEEPGAGDEVNSVGVLKTSIDGHDISGNVYKAQDINSGFCE